jgi:hypothetical protein
LLPPPPPCAHGRRCLLSAAAARLCRRRRPSMASIDSRCGLLIGSMFHTHGTGSTFHTILGRRPGPSPFLVPRRSSRYAEHNHVPRSRLLSSEPWWADSNR